MSRVARLYRTIGVLFCCHSVYTSAQTSLNPAGITHEGSRVTIVVDRARPLFEVINLLRDQYGWVIDYEDPIYSGWELVDDTSPDWRRKHPTSRGVTRPVGGRFVTSFDEGDAAAMQTSAGEERVLRSVVRDYNASGQSERFEVRKSASGRVAVIGTPDAASTGRQAQQSIMDTPISLELKSRRGDEALAAIFSMLSIESGKRVVYFGLANNLLMQTDTTLGGQHVPAREFLEKVASSTRICISFDALYDADANLYGVSISPATRTFTDQAGRQARDTIVPQDSETCGR
jgi:hypothetical protein